jgi:hypothetical protein
MEPPIVLRETEPTHDMHSAKSGQPSPTIFTLFGREAMSALTNITPANLSLLNNPEHWRDKAKEARLKVEEMTDPVARKTMQGVADNYENLAAQTAREASSNGRPIN